MVVEEAQERLWALSDEKRHAAEKLLTQMSEDEWLAHHAQRVLLALVELAQAEADRHVATSALLLDYCSLRCEEVLVYPGGAKPSLAELPLPEGVGLSVPLPADPSRPPTSDGAAKDAKGGKGGGKDAGKGAAKGGKDAKAPPSSEPP